VSEEKYRTLIENASEAIVVAQHGVIKFANPKGEELYGRSQKELAARPLTDFIHEEDRELVGERHKRRVRGEKPPGIYPFRIVNKAGNIKWVELTATPFSWDNDPAVLCYMPEITERKQAEEALKEANQSLEEMVYISSHDLQVPLISMEGYASELLKDYKNELDEEGVYCLSRLKQNAQRMHKLVVSLLDISRLNTKKYPFESFHPKKIIDNIAQDLSLTIEKSNVKIEIEEMPELYGDKQRIEGVFRRLITNAITYGGKKISIGYEDGAYFVKDNGIGIPENQLEKIFTPGERLKMTETKGVGMGLTFCKKVINQHNGKIWAGSEGIDKGSTFYFNLNGKITGRDNCEHKK
jgi:PAS domain S-box-containing protein